MNRTILLAIGALALGLALGTVGTLLLGAARAVAKHISSTHRRTVADLKQYAAALCALVGFLLIAGGGGLLTRELAPLEGPARTLAAAGVGVLLFAAAGVIFSRVADLAEEAKVRRLPGPSYQQVLAPEPPTPISSPPSPTSGPPAPEPRTGGRHASPPPAEDSPAGTSIEDGDALLRAVRPGWIYRDRSDRWYLGVVDEHTGGLPLLRLPDFALVAVTEPAYPLTVAGAGEIAVVPLPTVPTASGDDA